MPPAPPKRQGSHLSSGITSGFAAPVETHDQVRVYALEDTPLNFSTATSLSDLTVDEAVNSGRVSVDSQDGLIQHHPQNQNQRWVLILWQTLQNFLEGNIMTHNTKNCYIKSDKQLIATIDVENLSIIINDDVVLVSSLNSSESMRNIIQKMHKK